MADEVQDLTLTARLDRVGRLCAEAKGRPLYLAVVMLAHHRQAEGVRGVLESCTLEGLPPDTVLDITVLVMPDESGSRGEAGKALDAWKAQNPPDPRRSVEVLDAERPLGGIHSLFPYGRTVHRGVDGALARVATREGATGKRCNTIVLRVSGDVIVKDSRILTKLVPPLNDPEQPGVVVSSAIQESDWDRDELPRRRLIRPKMEAFLRDPRPLIPVDSSTGSGSLTAYMAPLFTEIGISTTWGGGEDGVGFTLLDPRLTGVMVRDARVFHCHSGRSMTEQLLSFGDWLYTGPINRLNRVSGRRKVDQTRAFQFFMSRGVLSERSRGYIASVGRVLGYPFAIHAARFCHSVRISLIMLWELLRA